MVIGRQRRACSIRVPGIIIGKRRLAGYVFQGPYDFSYRYDGWRAAASRGGNWKAKRRRGSSTSTGRAPPADEEEYIDVSECAFCVSNNKTGEGEKGPGAPATAPLRENRPSAASRRLPLAPASLGARRGAQGRGGGGSWRRARCGAAGLPHPQQSAAAAGRREARGAQPGGAHRARATACAINRPSSDLWGPFRGWGSAILQAAGPMAARCLGLEVQEPPSLFPRRGWGQGAVRQDGWRKARPAERKGWQWRLGRLHPAAEDAEGSGTQRGR
ncbi:hypothetical protein NDU88_005543 [Pleurodeles waltl]|uniref:Uncharacterized protein n=1 Tax=Pleurodeles waltl TaxID=8319 RepID=A0AAV7TCZ5_PLEWA|nr:hypothetical protein NDU88_005543 [Pleurodeles waltl]